MQASVHPSAYALRRLPESALLLGRSFQTKLNKLNEELVDLNERLTGRSRQRRPNEALEELLSVEKRLLETPLTVQSDEDFARRIDLILGLPPKSQPPANEWEEEGKRVLEGVARPSALADPRSPIVLPIYPPDPKKTPPRYREISVKQLKLRMESHPSQAVHLAPNPLSYSRQLHASVLPPEIASPRRAPSPRSPQSPVPRSVVVLYAGAHFPGRLVREDGAFVEVLFPDGVQARLLKTQLVNV